MTNLERSKSDLFINCCKKANCKPTTRQASKFAMGKGIAWKVNQNLINPLKEGDAGFQNYN